MTLCLSGKCPHLSDNKEFLIMKVENNSSGKKQIITKKKEIFNSVELITKSCDSCMCTEGFIQDQGARLII